jgi:drug/metabolite transporter (DMT)-like permease
VRARHWVLLVIASLGWGAGGVLTRASFDEGVDAVEFAFYRPAIAAAALAVYIVATRRPIPRSRAAWRDGLILGSSNLAAPFLFLTLAVVYASAGFVGLLVANVSVSTAVWSHLLGHERITRAKVVGLAVSFLGVLVLLVSGDSGLDEGGNAALAIGLAMLGLGAVGFGITYAKRALARTDPVSLALPQFAVGSALLGLLVPFTDGAPNEVTALGWVFIALAALLSTAIPFILFYEAMQHVTALQASLSGYIIPIFAVLLGAVWLDERVGPALLAGGALIFIGVILTDRAAAGGPAPPTE